MIDIVARVEAILLKAVLAEGLELVHIEYQPQGSTSLLRIYIDKQNGVNLEDCERVSKYASVLLDVEDFISNNYTLEVSSPGIERPLFRRGDYERFVGKEIRLMTNEKVDDRKKFTGFIQNFSKNTLRLKCDETTYAIPFGIIKKANLVHRFR